VRVSPHAMADTQTNNWLLSFGDLLTLILCIFLVLVSTGFFTIGQEPNESIHEKTSPVDPSTLAGSGGKSLATLTEEPAVEEQLLTAADFNDDGQIQRGGIREWLEVHDQVGNLVRVESCDVLLGVSEHRLDQFTRLVRFEKARVLLRDAMDDCASIGAESNVMRISVRRDG
jgi:hypothetical protein